MKRRKKMVKIKRVVSEFNALCKLNKYKEAGTLAFQHKNLFVEMVKKGHKAELVYAYKVCDLFGLTQNQCYKLRYVNKRNQIFVEILQLDLQTAVNFLENNKLSNCASSNYASSFVQKIRDYDKKALKKLTSEQFAFLRDIAKEKYNI